MTKELQLVADGGNGHSSDPVEIEEPSPEPSFQMDPEVERLLKRGFELRAMGEAIRERVGEVAAQLLEDFPGNESEVARVLEGESQRVRGIHEQTVRREREARRAKELEDGSNRGAEGDVSGGVQGVPTEQHCPGCRAKGSNGSSAG